MRGRAGFQGLGPSKVDSWVEWDAGDRRLPVVVGLKMSAGEP